MKKYLIFIFFPNLYRIIRILCRDLRNLVSNSFPESTYYVIGGFFFLRFVGPAIVSPDGFDVYEWSMFFEFFCFKIIDQLIIIILLLKELAPEARRALVLISKVIQNLGNGVEFGKKEEYMLPFNDLIIEKTPEVNAFFDELAVNIFYI